MSHEQVSNTEPQTSHSKLINELQVAKEKVFLSPSPFHHKSHTPCDIRYDFLCRLMCPRRVIRYDDNVNIFPNELITNIIPSRNKYFSELRIFDIQRSEREMGWMAHWVSSLIIFLSATTLTCCFLGHLLFRPKSKHKGASSPFKPYCRYSRRKRFLRWNVPAFSALFSPLAEVIPWTDCCCLWCNQLTCF